MRAPHLCALAVIVTLLCACAGAGSGVAPTRGSSEGFVPASNGTPTLETSGDLYVASLNPGAYGPNQISIYPPGDKKPAQVIHTAKINGGNWFISSLAFDSVGKLYVASMGEDHVFVYPAGQTSIAYTIGWGLYVPWYLVVDANDDLYVLNCPACESVPGYEYVVVYAPGKTLPSRTVTKGIAYGYKLALDGSGNLYVANCPLCMAINKNNGAGKPVFLPGSGSISVYAPGGISPARTITKGIDGPLALTFDSAGRLYVDNIGHKGAEKSSIAVYTAGSNSPTYTITQGLTSPQLPLLLAPGSTQVAIDSSSNLYALNFKNNAIEIYLPGQKMPRSTISVPGSGDISGFLFDNSGNLYVLNRFGRPDGYVYVYAEGQNNPEYEITNGIYNPYAFALRP